jgi:hypothetical protein
MALWPIPCIAGGAELFAALPWEFLARRVLPVILLTVLLVALLIQAHRIWQEIHEVDEPVSPDDLLSSFEQAHADGELDDEEFERVRLKLTSFPPEIAPRSPKRSTRAAPPPSEPRSPLDRIASEPDSPVDKRSP